MASPIDPTEDLARLDDLKAGARSDAGFDLAQDEEEIVRAGLDWRNQLTVRSLLFGILTGFLITFISMSIGLSGAGVSPGYSPVSALIGFSVLKPATALMSKVLGPGSVADLTRQEICIVQGVATSLQSLRHALGVSSWFWGLHNNVAAQLGPGPTFKDFDALQVYLEAEASRQGVDKDDIQLPQTVGLDFGTMVIVAFLIAFTGILIVTVFRKMYIVDLKLPFPSPVATAVMINALFSDDEAEAAAKQLRWFGRWTVLSFIWVLFDWLFTGTTTVGGKEKSCGFLGDIPIFGKAAYQFRWKLSIGIDYTLFVGVALILSPVICYSIILGGVTAYAIAYPIMYGKGTAFPDFASFGVNGTGDYDALLASDFVAQITEAGLAPADWKNVTTSESDKMLAEGPYWFNDSLTGLDGFYGYQVMFGVGIMLADGLFAMCMMCYILFDQWRLAKRNIDPASKELELQGETDDERAWRINVRIFTEDKIDDRIIAALYLLVSIVGAIGLPAIYGVSWYMIMVAFIMTPFFSLIGNYIAGLTDWNLMSNFAKLAALIFSIWGTADSPDMAVVVALFCCGIVYCGGSNSTDIIGDLYTGFLTQTSPKAMIIAQLIGFIFGCVVVPGVFFIFYTGNPDIGWPNTRYPNSYGGFYRAMAMIGTGGGFDALPRYCLDVTYFLFVFSFFMPLCKMLTISQLEKRSMKTATSYVEFWWPSMAAFGIPFIAGVAWVVPVAVGFAIRQIWARVKPELFELLHQPVAAGILVGCGLGSMPLAIFALVDVAPPGCISFKPLDEPGWSSFV